MRTTKLGAALASLAITTGTATLLAAGPAQADTATQVVINLGGYGKLTAPYGTYLGTFTVQITDGTDPVTVGAADLQERRPGKDWKVVKSDSDVSETTGDGISFGRYGTKAKGNVKYRVHYLGGTDEGTATTYSESYSNPVIVRTTWNLHDNGVCAPRCKIYGHLSPKAKHHKVTIQVKHGSWKRYKVVHTNARSHWSAFVKPTRGRGTLYRAVVAGTKNISKGFSFRIYRAYIDTRSARNLSPR
jgi:hypothetical protein